MDQQSFFTKIALTNWEQSVKRTDTLFNQLSDEQLTAAVAPERNSGAYLLGHLVATSDNLFPILGLGERLYPQLDEVFLRNPDKAFPQPSIAELRTYWAAVNEKLSPALAALSDADWFDRHNLVSREDFAREPHRNKLNVLLNRTNHQEYHRGQLKFLS